jgi:hypothetical protein
LCFDESFARFVDRALRVDESGKLVSREGKSNVRLVTSVDREAFIGWYVDRIASLVPPDRNPGKFVEQGAMPHRVHVAEDYDGDIERRWWMSGKAETRNVPAGSRRACRGVLTHDFDDLLMASRQMYAAVIFNPVPGPPMGKNPRLRFRYWLKGTDALRIQIYSLSNGYHRQLVVKGLPQEKWQEGTVDMTQARRPDGTGGPLGENERIDDIQFYADPNAELIIDDVVLYDAAAAGETRPFPKRVLFTGWFDTGKQGQEWPGTFEIVADQESFWKVARSVKTDAGGHSWIRLHLRGPRTLGTRTHLSFRYRLTDADSMRVLLHSSTGDARLERQLQALIRNAWSEATVDFTEPVDPSKPAPGKPEVRVDEIHFLIPEGAELRLDDLLLFEPGETKVAAR